MKLGFLLILLFTSSLLTLNLEQEKIFTVQLNYGYILKVQVYPYKPPDIPLNLTLSFKLSLILNNKTVEHVTYSVNITDESGNIIEKLKDIHSHMGILEFNYAFPSKGKYYLIVEIVSIGMENPIKNVGRAILPLFIGIPEETATTTPSTIQTIIPYDFLIFIVTLIAVVAIVIIFFLVKKKKK
mgnify:CR=1 FL=1|jgi:hypothetical protein